MSRAIDGAVYKNQGAGTLGPFHLDGGVYAMEAIGTWGGGNADLQRLGPDNSTYVTCGTATKMTANGFASPVYLPRGTYQFVITTSTGVYVELQRVQGE